MVVNRFQVWLVDLDPVKGSEISKTRPCIVISPDETNRYLNTVTIASMTTTYKNYPTRVDCIFNRQKGQIALDQIRSIKKIRLVKKLGIIDENIGRKVSEVLVDIFSY
ncbi:MAG: transcriptional regulator [Segetibacter sp.]|nr:transcriptional regulator [Segetibacter sp.]